MLRSKFNRAYDLSRKFSPQTILRFIVHLPSFVRLSWRLLDDPRVPFTLKLLCYGSIAYIFLPFDLIPDFPSIGIGQVDDVVLVYLAFSNLMKQSPPDVVQEHVQAISQGK